LSQGGRTLEDFKKYIAENAKSEGAAHAKDEL
jgi:hypothetical protein